MLGFVCPVLESLLVAHEADARVVHSLARAMHDAAIDRALAAGLIANAGAMVAPRPHRQGAFCTEAAVVAASAMVATP